MGFSEVIAEYIREGVTGDVWYREEHPYALELRSITGSAVFVFPRGPTTYTVGRTFRSSVTPTIGGTIAEERGLLWREIMITGTFGWEPKVGYDTSLPAIGEAIAVPGVTKLSGPGWTRRMVRNIFEKYASLKADPLQSPYTSLCWHDMKTDEHWVIVPEQVEIARTVDKRFQYPFSIKAKGVAEAGAPLVPIVFPGVGILGAISNALSAINAAVVLVASAVQEASAILGEVRYFVASIDSILTNVDQIVSSASDFADGLAATIACGRTLITSTLDIVQDALALMEDADALPAEVRQTFQAMADGLDQIACQVGSFGETYGEATAGVTFAESGAANESKEALEAATAAGPPATSIEMSTQRITSTDQALLEAGVIGVTRVFGKWAGFKDYRIGAADTLPSIAASQLGDGGLWYELAVINGLKSPYISRTGAPGTVKPGDVISIPVRVGSAAAVVVPNEDAPGVDPYGTDFALVDTSDSYPGHPSVDLAIDAGTSRDCRTIRGVGNLVQALQMRMWTEQGSIPMIPDYGLRRIVGYGSTAANAAALRLGVRSTIASDSRVSRVSRFDMTIVDDVVTIDADVVPVGTDTVRTVTASLT